MSPTQAPNRWSEVTRVTRLHRCESLLLGFGSIVELGAEPGFNEMVTDASCNVVLLRIPPDYDFPGTRRVLVPLGGRGMHSPLRGRLLRSLRRQVALDAAYVGLVDRTA